MKIINEEWHYAPMNGGIIHQVDGVRKQVKNWSEHHELIVEFQRLRKENLIVFSHTINYGHDLYNGHSGRVDVYVNI